MRKRRLYSSLLSPWSQLGREALKNSVGSASECSTSFWCERANPVPNEGEFSEEVEDMLARTRTNPKAIIHGTFHLLSGDVNILNEHISGNATNQAL